MNSEFEKKLFEKYPKIFAGKDKPITESLMPFGFECGDGWFWLIDGLCQSIQNHVDGEIETARIRKTDIVVEELQVEALQVKEKYGGLRFYTGGHDDIVEGMIQLAESLSTQICEQCGEEGKRTGEGWIFTLCDKCNNKRLGEGK